ncbi:hypothetical protein [Vulcanisaeta distributa]|uniref:Uncharacterized protein n=1 Tax=Vulcanisaeta distributa (strain DSM 14429 / JCM 11212 / NBRC 100878 / IC-017) TaxID=572478 RepID=E1QRE8_VULDI|nr:hypothetical protein [Vulcanisaeta distributa]ADN50645.1 hypothetical protein Vdis_1259 [Vulcanisaeta distributa DSM 14429]
MAKYELRRYITYGQLIMWPRLIVNIKDHVKIMFVTNLSNKGEIRSIRCSRIELIKHRPIAQ